MKKLFSIMATVALVLGMFPAVNANAAYSAELEDAYGYAFNMGITTQSSIENADMYGTLTRVALAKMISNYVLELGLQTADTSAKCEFTDVSEALDTQYANGVTNACQLGLMGVGITAFRPFDTVTRAEFGTVLSRAIWGDANNGSDPYYVNHLNALKEEGVMTNISNPSAKEVRGYVMLMMQRADENGVASGKPAICSTPENILACSLELDSCPAECTADEEEVVLPGFATVARVGSEVSMSVPKNANSVKVGTIKLTAGENDTTVSSVVVERSGLGNVREVVSLQLLQTNGVAASIISNGMSSSTQTATLRFSPSLVLKAGSSENFDVVVSLSGADNNEHTFAVSAVNVANGTAAGTPVKLGTLRTTSYNAGTVTLANLIGGTSIVAGKTNQTIATVDLQPTDKDAVINGFTITKDSGEDFTKAFNNVKAYYNGLVVGNVIVDAEKITVSNLNIDRMNGETANVELKGDGTYIGDAGVITGSIATSDIFAVEKTTGFPMFATLTFTGKAIFNLTTIDMTLTKLTTSSQTVAPGTSSVELFKAKISSDATFDLSDYEIAFVSTTGTAGQFIDDKVTVYVDGIDYEMSATTTGAKTFTLAADRLRVEPGHDVIVRVAGNVRSTAAAGVNYRMKLTLKKARNVSNGTEVSLGARSIEGDTVTVNNGTYTVTKPTSIPNNKTILEGSASDALYFNLRAAAENQVVKQVKVTSTVAFSGYASKVALMQGNTELKSFSNDTDLATGTLVFDSLSTALTKDTTVPFTIRVTLRAGEVENLGTSIKVDLTSVNVVRSVNQTIATSTNSSMIAGNTYQIASNIPVVALPGQDGKNTIISFASTSNYDVEVVSGAIEMTRNLVNGSYVNWSGTVKLLDSINGAEAGTTAGNAPGAVTFTFAGSGLVVDTTAVERVIELVDPANTVTDADYTVTVKNVTFRYVDRNDGTKSAVITESYNIAK